MEIKGPVFIAGGDNLSDFDLGAMVSKLDRTESKIIYLSPKGKPFTQETAETLALEKNIIFI